MGSKFLKFFSKLIFVILIYALIFSNIAWTAGIDNTTHSNLSPSVKINLSSFNRTFQTIYFGNSTRSNELKTNKNESYEMLFDKWAPDSLKTKIIKAIQSQLIPTIKIKTGDVKTIKIRFYKSSDEYLDFCKKEGKLKDLILDNQGRMIYRADYAGLKAKARINYIIKQVAKIFGGRKQDYEKKINDAKIEKGEEGKEEEIRKLWGMYYRHLAEVEFKKKLLDTDWIEFKVVVSLKDRKIEKEIKLEKKEGVFRPSLVEEQKEDYPHFAKKAMLEDKPLRSEKLSDYIQDPEIRQKVYKLVGQREPFLATLSQLESLLRVKDVYLANRRGGVSPQDFSQAAQALNEFSSWVEKRRGKNKKDKEQVEELKQYSKLVKAALAKRHYKKTIKQIDEIVKILRSRLEKHIGIMEHTKWELLGHARVKANAYLYIEVFKSLAFEIEAEVRRKKYEAAFHKSGYFTEFLIGHEEEVFKEKLKKYPQINDKVSAIRQASLKAMHYRRFSEPLDLINEVDEQIKRQAEIITKIKESGLKGFKGYQGILEAVVSQFEIHAIKQPDKFYSERIFEAVKRISHKIIFSAEGSKSINEEKRQSFVPRLKGVVNALNRIKGDAERFENAISKIIPGEEEVRELGIIGVETKLNRLRGQVLKDTSFEDLVSELINHLERLAADLNEFQNEFKQPASLTPIGDTIPNVLDNIQPKFAEELIEQAI